jgi:leader peptidase (prepilin peptidase)/N-methyltransferase
MHVFWYIFFVVLGLVIASFLNVCIDRLPRNQSIVNPPSHCDSCQRRLAAKDLIPIYSYLRTKGKCSYCGAPIPRRVLGVEIGTGAYFGFLFWRFGLTPDLGIVAFYSCIFIVLMVIDLENSIILNIIVIPSMLLSLIINSLLPLFKVTLITPFISIGILGNFLSCLIGSVIGFIIFFLIYKIGSILLRKEAMGLGDLYLISLIGLITGWPNILVAILLSAFIGGLVAIILLILKIRGMTQPIPYGPILIIGAMATLLYGKVILDWYLKIIGLN